MSASLWDWPLASADGLLTNEQCSMLLESDILNEDLLKGFPPAAPKCEDKNLPHFQDDINTSLYPPSPVEEKPNQADLGSELLQQFDNQCKQENIFSNWLEEKVELPIFDSISAVGERIELPVVAQPVAYPAPQPTEELLREFETVYGAVELTHLTPPQSPPGPATQLLLSYVQQAQLPPTDAWSPAPPAADYDVDEFVRHRAAQLPSPRTSATPSPRSSPPSSPSSPRSSTDDEWAAPSRSKPYSRNPDDRRSRKKEQNKNAATRYRQKKKAEIEVLLGEEQALRQRHNELGDKCSDLQREIRYLKGLMRDLFKARGLIK